MMAELIERVFRRHFGFDGRQGDKWKYHVEGPEFGGLRFLDSSLAPELNSPM